ncbi:hypothetical protein V1517DRAFT_321097 [Lipomyces orientalis]|uniref:Uncharacterized protein n=1 Tax=Lipomyces orientalis TaxID=1233043 RepID=A0ACC3TQG7_9ASCO
MAPSSSELTLADSSRTNDINQSSCSPPPLRPRLTTLGTDFTRAFATLAVTDPPFDVDDIDSECCGGGCYCLSTSTMTTGTATPTSLPSTPPPSGLVSIDFPTTRAFDSLRLPMSKIARSSRFMGVPALPPSNIDIVWPVAPVDERTRELDLFVAPSYLKPHYPYDIHNVPVLSARLLTGPDAVKRTYHFDLDVTDYPDEMEDVDFRVGGAVGICPPNDAALVDDIFKRLGVLERESNLEITLVTKGGRWPTIWGEDKPRSVQTTMREILTWTVDINNGVFSKNLLRVLAEYCSDKSEFMILSWLCSRQGQSTFCNLRSDPYPPTLMQLLSAFPSSNPPFSHLVSVLPTLMPRFYSLSSDPICEVVPVNGELRERKVTPADMERVSSIRMIEVAVTVHEALENWRGQLAVRPGNCTAFLERVAHLTMKGQKVTIPMFRGLQANPLAREFRHDGPMLLIGAGVGISPFRGFVQRRLKNANCKNKVWVLQGCRDSLVDELYAGEWGVDDSDIRKVVESRRGTKKYVQDEVVDQSVLVWSVISHPEGRVFVCGSSKGMAEGVDAALKRVAMKEGNMTADEADGFWNEKERTWQYVTETW